MKKLFSSEWPGITVCALGVVVALLGMESPIESPIESPKGNQVDLGVGFISFGTALLFLASLHTQKQQLAQQHEELELQRKELAHQSTEFARQNKLAVWQTMVEYFVVLLEKQEQAYRILTDSEARDCFHLIDLLLPNGAISRLGIGPDNIEFWRISKHYAEAGIAEGPYAGRTIRQVYSANSREPAREFEYFSPSILSFIEPKVKHNLFYIDIKGDNLKNLYVTSTALIHHLNEMRNYHTTNFDLGSPLWNSLGVKYLFVTEWMVLNLYHLLFFRGEVQLAQFLAQHIIIDRPLRIWALQQAADLLRQGRTDLFENL